MAAEEQGGVSGGLVVGSRTTFPHEQEVQSVQDERPAAPRLIGTQSVRINDREYMEYSNKGDSPPSFLIQHIFTTMQKSSDRFRDCTRLFLSLQSKTILWHMIEDLSSLLSRGSDQRREEQSKLLEQYKIRSPPSNEMQRRANALLDFLDDRIADDSGFFFHPSPAGDIPLHLFFLLRVSDLCSDVIRQVYIDSVSEQQTETKISTPFKSHFRWLASEEGVNSSNSFTIRTASFKRMPSMNLSTVGAKASLKDFVGFDQTIKEWEKKGWTVDAEGWHDMGLYTGLTVLHIAIANQHIDEVEMLLQTARADIRARATGAFFQPALVTPYKAGARQKFSAMRKQLVFMAVLQGKTMLSNEKSGFYAGELPLSFAASVGNVETMRILVEHVGGEAERQALVEATDSFGNTALHMAVYHDRLDAVDWLMKNGARPCMTMLNVMGLTPFTVAAFVGNARLLLHMLRVHMARPLWEFGNMHSVEINMAQLDSFRIGKVDDAPVPRTSSGEEPVAVSSLSRKFREWSYGRRHGPAPQQRVEREDDGESLQTVAAMHASPCWRSAVEIIVTHQVEAMTSSDDNPEVAQLVKHVIDEKWRRFAGKRHLWSRAIPFMVLVLFFSLLFIWRCSVLRQDRAIGDGLEAAEWTEARRRTVWGMEVAMVAVSVPWLLWCWYKYLKIEFSSLDVNMDGEYDVEEIIIFCYKNMQPAGDFSAVSCIFICSMCRIAGAEQVELVFYTFLVVVLWANAMSLLLPSPTFGSLTFMIYRMLVGDIFKFLVIYVLLLLGFGLALFGLLQRGDFPRDADQQTDLDCVGCDVYFFTLVQKLVYVSMGEVEQVALLEHMELPALGTALFILYSVLSLLLLLNLIIAMMGDTYLKASRETERDWFWPYACLVLQYEQEMSASGRQRHRLGLSSETETEQGDQTYAPFVYYRETTTTVGHEQPHLLL